MPARGASLLLGMVIKWRNCLIFCYLYVFLLRLSLIFVSLPVPVCTPVCLSLPASVPALLYSNLFQFCFPSFTAHLFLLVLPLDIPSPSLFFFHPWFLLPNCLVSFLSLLLQFPSLFSSYSFTPSSPPLQVRLPFLSFPSRPFVPLFVSAGSKGGKWSRSNCH